MVMNERQDLELKRQVSKSFLKTVSAFSNYSGGVIIFGIDDAGHLVGIESVESTCLTIENMINDTIEPLPDFCIEVVEEEGKYIIELIVTKGRDTPYYYRGKAYKRSGTSTVEVDRFELRRLALAGINIDYEERKARSQDLDFSKLELDLKAKIGIKSLNEDILRTLNLYNKDGYYNVAAELLADNNEVDFSGLDIVKFGKQSNIIHYRETISKNSLLLQYERAVELFGQYYHYEKIEGYKRIQKELIPKEAFREALANAIIHRVWDTNAYIQIGMYDDRIEISSPGGLPVGLSEEEYLKRSISVLRNPIIAGVFYRLDMVEKFGTGIARIKDEYKNSLVQPSFVVSQNSVVVVLPVFRGDSLNLSYDEIALIDLLSENIELSRRELDNLLGFRKEKTLRLIGSLIKQNVIQKQGRGPGTRYRLK